MSEADLERRVADLEARISTLAPPRVVVLRDVSFEEAKREILDFASTCGEEPIYASDIELDLRIPYDLALRALHSLVAEGHLRKGLL